MKVTLLYRDREWGKEKSYFDKEEICKDLNLHILFRAAGSLYDEEDGGKTVKVGDERDDYVSEMVKRVMLVPLMSPEEVHYRQQIIKEAVTSYDRTAELYQVAKKAMEDITKFSVAKKKQGYGGSTDQGRRNVANIEYLEHMVYHLDMVEAAIGHWRDTFVTEEMAEFADNFSGEYRPEYKLCLGKVVKDLRTSTMDGIIEVTAALGPGLSMSPMVLCDLREPAKKEKTGFLRNTAGKIGEFYKSLFETDGMTLEGENQNLLQDIGEIKNAALGAIMRYFEVFLEEKENFFKQLYAQTAFLMGAANLYRRIRRIGVDVCFPKITDRENICFEGLVEMSLAINSLRCPVDNSLNANGKYLMVVTGANQGGKSTYLRSIGIAQMLLQCGMFVPAKSFSSGLYRNVFTHFTRREDSAMNSGRLDEELGRMERIVDNLTKDSILFLNESFATTTEKEGSVIAEDITDALYERGVRVMMVTHLMAFARNCYAKSLEHAVFLSAERETDGHRTFRMVEQEPELTSYGLDLYEGIIGKAKPEPMKI